MARSIGALGLAALLLGSVVALSGCGAAAEKAAEMAVEQQTGAEIDKDGDKITVTTEEGEQVTAGTGTELPDGFPEDVPVHEGTIASTMTSPEGKLVTIQAATTPADAMSWYKGELESGGWKIVTEVKSADFNMITAEKDANMLQISIAEDGGPDGALISLMVSPKE